MSGNSSLTTIPPNISLRMNTCNNEPVCMNVTLEVFGITLDIISAVATMVHIYIISRLKKTDKSIFHTNLYYANVLDVLMPTAGFVGHPCWIRKAMLDNIAIGLVTTAYAFILVILKYASLLFSVIDRWLNLSKPFLYKSYGFVRIYLLWLSMVTISPMVYYGAVKYRTPFCLF